MSASGRGAWKSGSEAGAGKERPGPRGRRADMGSSGASADRPGATQVCDLCGGPVLDRHCKIVCLNCGYQRDCSDP